MIDAVAPTGPLMLVGHSMGGMTIMALASQRPELFDERVYGVALIATTAGGLATGPLGLPPGVGQVFHRIAPPVAAALARRAAEVALAIAHACNCPVAALYVAQGATNGPRKRRGFRARQQEQALMKDFVEMADRYDVTVQPQDWNPAESTGRQERIDPTLRKKVAALPATDLAARGRATSACARWRSPQPAARPSMPSGP